MKNILTTLVCSVSLVSSCKKETLRGGGTVKTETRQLPAFTNVELGGAEDATISYGVTRQVTVTGYENLLPVYETNVAGNTLYLKFRSDIFNVRNSNVKVSITLPALAYMRINGSGNITAKGFPDGDDLSAFINGSGAIFIKDSRYDKANYSVNGSGDIKAATTQLSEGIAQVSGSGNIEVKVSNKLKATIFGSGNINYWGNPVNLETHISGSGKIKKN